MKRLGWAAVLGLLVSGCAQPKQQEPIVTTPAPELQPAPQTVRLEPAPVPQQADPDPDPQQDPQAYLAWAEARFEAMQQYTLTFERTERRGIMFKSMKGPEKIRCWYRREPFSIRMKWLDPEIKYGESSYVRGQFNDRVRFIPRHGLFGLPPTLTRVSLQTPVIWGEARYPVSDFGYERVLEKTLDVIVAAGPQGQVTYQGSEPGPRGDGHVIRVVVPGDLSDTPQSELVFDQNSHQLVCNRLYNAAGELEATYTYAELDLDVSLTDADFLLEGEQAPGDVVASTESGS